MADTVRYVTRMDTTMPPTTESGFNAFPFLWKWGNPSIDPHPEFYPISMPLEEHTNTTASIARLYKRVKKWKIDTDATVTDGVGNTYTFDSGNFTPSTNNPTRELNNVLPPGTANADREHFPNTLVNGGGLGVAGTFRVIMAGSFYVDGTNYYPFLTLTTSLFSINFSFVDFSPGGNPSFSGEVDGITIPVYHDAAVSPVTLTASRFKIKPAEFWPYAATGGSPIYNTTTGAVLQNPRN